MAAQVLQSSVLLMQHVLGASVLAKLDFRWRRLAKAAGAEQDDEQGKGRGAGAEMGVMGAGDSGRGRRGEG